MVLIPEQRNHAHSVHFRLKNLLLIGLIATSVLFSLAQMIVHTTKMKIIPNNVATSHLDFIRPDNKFDRKEDSTNEETIHFQNPNEKTNKKTEVS